jgi:hypothetical protein
MEPNISKNELRNDQSNNEELFEKSRDCVSRWLLQQNHLVAKIKENINELFPLFEIFFWQFEGILGEENLLKWVEVRDWKSN